MTMTAAATVAVAHENYYGKFYRDEIEVADEKCAVCACIEQCAVRVSVHRMMNECNALGWKCERHSDIDGFAYDAGI